MILERQCFISLLYLLITCIPIDFQNLVVIFFLRLFLFSLGLFDLGSHVCTWIKLLYLTVIHHCRSVFSSFHIEIGPSDQRFIVLRIQLERFVQIVKGFEGLLSLHKRQGTVGIYNRVELFVGRIKINSFSILLFSFIEFATFYQFISFFFQLLTLLGSVQGQSAFFLIWIKPHTFCEVFFGPRTFSSIQLNNSFQVPKIRRLLVISNWNSLEKGQCFCDLSSLCKCLYLELFQFLILWNFEYQIVNARKRLSKIRFFHCLLIFVKI